MTGAWDFAVAAWRKPGVESVCLALQDDYGQSPALVLWRLWALAAGRAVAPATLAMAIEVARPWRVEVIDPLRAVRVRLKTGSPAIIESVRLELRGQVQAAELAAEQALIAALEGLTPTTVSPDQPAALSALRAVVEPPVPDAILAQLIQAASSVEP